MLGEPALLQNSGGGGRGDSVDPNPNPNPKGAAPEELPDVPADLTYSERRERERLARLGERGMPAALGGTSTSPGSRARGGRHGGAHRDEYREYGDGYGDGARIGYDAATAEPSLDYQQGYDQQRQQQIQDGDVTWSQDEQGNWWYQYPGQEAAMYVEDPSVAATGGGGEGRSGGHRRLRRRGRRDPRRRRIDRSSPVVWRRRRPTAPSSASAAAARRPPSPAARISGRRLRRLVLVPGGVSPKPRRFQNR